MIPPPRRPLGQVPSWSAEPGCVEFKEAHPEADLTPAAGMPHAVVPLPPSGSVEVFGRTWAEVIARLRKRAPELFRKRRDSG